MLIATNMDETSGEDRIIARMGISIAEHPLGVRYGKMLLVASPGWGPKDYAIAMVPDRSENSPFTHGPQFDKVDDDDDDEDEKDTSEEP
jgi:hypothetical protein